MSRKKVNDLKKFSDAIKEINLSKIENDEFKNLISLNKIFLSKIENDEKIKTLEKQQERNKENITKLIEGFAHMVR